MLVVCLCDSVAFDCDETAGKLLWISVWPMSLVLAPQTAGVQCNIQSLIAGVWYTLCFTVTGCPGLQCGCCHKHWALMEQ